MRHPHINSRLGGFIAEQFSHMLESSYNWIQIVPPGCLGRTVGSVQFMQVWPERP